MAEQSKVESKTGERSERRATPAALDRDGVTSAPMLKGDPSEPVGPEDALGSGQKRGDYAQWQTRTFSASVPNPDYDPSDPDSPASVIVVQNPLVEQRGDEKGVKGGTHPLTDEVKGSK